MWYVTCWYYESLTLQRSCVFGKTLKNCLIDSNSQIELSCTKSRCGVHEMRPCAGGIQVAQGDLHLQIGGV